MKKTGIRAAALTAALLLTVFAAGCGSAPNTGSGVESAGSPSGGSAASAPPAGSTALRGVEWDESSATQVTLNGGSIEVEGSGANPEGATLTVTAAGTYVLSGSLTGQVVVDVGKDDVVRLVLNGARIQGTENAGIYCKQAEELILTLADGTENAVSDADDFAYADTVEEEPDAALFSKKDLVLNGGGSLTVNASFNNGIGTKDDLVIEGGTYTVNAANHGIRGRDSVTILDGGFDITSGSDGIQSNNDSGEENKGRIALEGGSFAIAAGRDGVQAETSLTVTGGDYRITAGGHSAGGLDAAESYKGLKAGVSLAVSGGSFQLDCGDDALHSNGDIAIAGGTFAIATGDDGVHADGDLTVSGGAIDISASYEGLEAMTMTLSGGEIRIVASDDGINVAGGNDSTGEGLFGPDAFGGGGASSDRWLKITGGAITVSAEGDGIDVNGNAEMTGGTLYVHGPTRSMDGALDYDGTFLVSGGTLAAAGSAGMAQASSAGSEQPALMLYFSGSKPAGTVVELRDSGGSALVTYTAEKVFQCVLLSAPGMKDGETYTVYADGEPVVEKALSGSVTSITDTGEERTAGMGRGGGFQGGGQRPGRMGSQGDMPPPADGRQRPSAAPGETTAPA